MLRAYRGILPTLGARVYIDAAAVVIGQVSIGDDASLWPCAVVRGDVNTITIGARTSVQDGSVLHVTHDGPYSPGGVALQIGEDVTIGHAVVLHACTVGDRCLIGMGATVLDRAVIESEVLLAAGSVVPPGRRLHSGFLYRGSPVQQARALLPEEIASFRYAAANYVRLKDEYLASY